jgi:hypothetical protein
MSPDQLADLRTLAERTGPFFTVVLPTPSRIDDAEHRFGVEWSNTRRELEADWPSEELDEVDAMVSELSHGAGEAVVIVHTSNGPTHVEFIDETVGQPVVAHGDAASLMPLLAARQRTVPHLLVATDRAGADITAFDGGEMLASEQVQGDTEHIHRGHPGGWSQRRFQQRAENTWERNADDVAEAAAELAQRVGAELVLVAGDVRAQNLVIDAMKQRSDMPIIAIEAGDEDGIADEARRLLANHVAEHVTSLAEQLRARVGTGAATVDEDEVMAWLTEGRVDTLLVYDDELRGSDAAATTDEDLAGVPAGNRVVDTAVVGALTSSADIVVVPRLAVMTGPVAALARW